MKEMENSIANYSLCDFSGNQLAWGQLNGDKQIIPTAEYDQMEFASEAIVFNKGTDCYGRMMSEVWS